MPMYPYALELAWRFLKVFEYPEGVTAPNATFANVPYPRNASAVSGDGCWPEPVGWGSQAARAAMAGPRFWAPVGDASTDRGLAVASAVASARSYDTDWEVASSGMDTVDGLGVSSTRSKSMSWRATRGEAAVATTKAAKTAVMVFIINEQEGET